ncbi:MAG: EAL domain-containing protein [Pseudomonadota bacterium]
MSRALKPGFGALFLGLFLWATGAVCAHGAEAVQAVRIGVLAFRDIEQTARTWIPLARYLEQSIPNTRFQVIALHNEDLEQAVARNEVEFVLTQPEQYVVLRNRHGLAAQATLMPLAEGRPLLEFGGVIFTRAERRDIRALDDLRGRRLAAVYEQSLGAYRIQQWTLLQAGLRLPEEARMIFTGQPQDNVVKAVLEGRADAGFVRTGVLESLAREGKLDLAQVKIINDQKRPGFPLYLSTELVPEWPFSAMRGVPEPLSKAVTLALLRLQPGSDATRAGGFYGFAPPGDYTPLEAMLQRLKAYPDHLNRFDARDVAEKYRWELTLLLVLLLAFFASVALRLRRDNTRIAKAAQERNLLLGNLAEGVCGFDREGHCTFINPAARTILGLGNALTPSELHHPMFHFLEGASQDIWDESCPLRSTLVDGRHREGEAQVVRTDNDSRIPVHYSITPLRDDGGVRGVVVAFQDITERKEREAAQRVAAVAFETQEGMLITDEHARILRVNSAFTEVTGYCADEAIGQTPALLKSGRHDKDFYETLWHTLKSQRSWQGEIWNRRKNGEVYPQWLTITAVCGEDGQVCHYVGTFLDISQRKQAEAQIEYMALYDPLTALPNRRLLLERLGQALVSRSRASRYGALLFIDLDNFKTLNDTQGHDMGDQLLVQVAKRLKACVREQDTVARLGGDEFIVMLEDLGEEPEQAAVLAEVVGEKILATLAQPYSLSHKDHHNSASIGITLFHNHDHTVEELLKRADMAMYQAKSAGRNGLHFFDPAMQAAVEARAALEAELRGALKRREFQLYYQPQVDSQGRILGAEALVRWQHPHQGLLSPGAFIPVAESSGLILPLGQQVMEIACTQLALWQAHPATAHLSLAVNVSARQFRQGDFVERVQGALRHSGANPAGLKLEITESMMLDSLDTVIEKMQALKALGVSFSLDDFGTGYSSLAYLKRLPLDQIKIDQSFVREALHSSNDATITRTVLALGETFGLSVIAEGVETADQHRFLESHGCKAFQGYLFGRPMSIEALTDLLGSNPA